MTILVSAVVSLTLTPMMCAQAAEAQAGGASRAASIRASERAFEGVIAFYGRTLTWVLRAQTDHAAGGGRPRSA